MESGGTLEGAERGVREGVAEGGREVVIAGVRACPKGAREVGLGGPKEGE